MSPQLPTTQENKVVGNFKLNKRMPNEGIKGSNRDIFDIGFLY